MTLLKTMILLKTLPECIQWTYWNFGQERRGLYGVVNGCRLWCGGMIVMHCILRIMKISGAFSDVVVTTADRQRPLVGDISFLKTKLSSR